MSETYLNERNIDDVGRMLYALLTELWIMRDRVAIMEKLLVDRGAIHPSEIDDYEPSGEFKEALEQLRDRMVTTVIGAPLVKEGMGVDALLARAGLKRPKQKK